MTPQGQQTAYTNLFGNYNFTYTGTVGTPTVVVIDPTWLAQNLITGFAPVTIQIQHVALRVMELLLTFH